MYDATWHEITCDACKQTNFVYDGHMLDMTVPDIDQFECWNCRAKWKICDGGELEKTFDNDCIEGKHFINADKIPTKETDRG